MCICACLAVAGIAIGNWQFAACVGAGPERTKLNIELNGTASCAESKCELGTRAVCPVQV